MSTLTQRYSVLESKLDQSEDIFLTIQGIHIIIEYSFHGMEQSKHRSIYQAATVDMIQRGFNDIVDLQSGERFILVDNNLGISIIGAVRGIGGDILISVITTVDSTTPTNPHNTHTIAI